MRLLFISDYHLPQAHRGVEVNTHALCTALQAEGCSAAVLARLRPQGLLGAWSRAKLKLSSRRRLWTAERLAGYATYRAWRLEDALEGVIAHAAPDVAVFQGTDRAAAGAAAACGVPVLLYFHIIPHWPDVPALPRGRYLANSRFCQRRMGERHGIDCAVVPPIVPAEPYRTRVTPEEVTVVGLSRDKGGEIVLGAAERLPEIPFRVFTNDPQGGGRGDRLLQRAAQLPNVRLNPPQRSNAALYRRSRLIFAPSQWEETWGRVVTEAQVNGIPAIASDRGGLPEAVGEGGLCLPHDAPVGEWARAIEEAFRDPVAYQRYREGVHRSRARRITAPESVTAALLGQARRLVDTAGKAARAPEASPC